MQDWPDGGTQRGWWAEARAVAGLLRVPLHRRAWEGRIGNWAGAGRGTSLDFHDQRPYVPGDDPRHVNWQAYARTDLPTMKLFHEEVSPAVDVLCDVSRSMRADGQKRARTFVLLFFLVESLRMAGSALRVTLVSGARSEELPPAALQSDAVPAPAGLGTGEGQLIPDRARLRPGALRVLVSDALFPDTPETIARTLVSMRGQGIVLAPWSAAEAEPDWEGPLELTDVETGHRRREHVGVEERARYRAAYERHFASWREVCSRHGIAFARVPAAGSLSDALRPALAAGALEALP